jgi:chemotaxis protein CheZ
MTVDTASPSGRARAEIETIDLELDRAFDRILDAVERVSTAAESMAPEMAEGILVAVTEILEAASVRDIAGQRLTAVRDAVDHLSDTIHRPTEGGLERNRDKSAKIEEKHDHGSSSESGLLNGPQLPGAAKTQSEVDALFDKLD